jgi:hypothetical protein
MIQISFQLFVILIFSDVLREIPGDVAENLKKRFTRLEKAMQARPVNRAGAFLFFTPDGKRDCKAADRRLS